jgi:hypothetical protein
LPQAKSHRTDSVPFFLKEESKSATAGFSHVNNPTATSFYADTDFGNPFREGRLSAGPAGISARALRDPPRGHRRGRPLFRSRKREKRRRSEETA